MQPQKTKREGGSKSTPSPNTSKGSVKKSPSSPCSSSSPSKLQPTNKPKTPQQPVDFLRLQVLISSRDEGAMAIVSPSVMLQLGLHHGDLLRVSISGQKQPLPPCSDYAKSSVPIEGTIVRPVSASPKIPSNHVEMDAVACENISAVAGATVEIRTVAEGDVIEATECFLRPIVSSKLYLDDKRTMGEMNDSHADESLAMTVVAHTVANKHFLLGNEIESRVYGRLRRWKIVSLLPELSQNKHSPDHSLGQVYRITVRTRLRSHIDLPKLESESKVNITNEITSVSRPGGLDEQIAQLEALLRLPLTNPEVFSKYGIRSPKAALLCGPPGTGKTHLVRYLAFTTRAKLYTINGPDVLTKYYGETEAKLREIFRDAKRNPPSIIFIDEIDALCPKREEATTGTEKRIVGTLLSELDALHELVSSSESRYQSSESQTVRRSSPLVVVLAATNRPNSLDESLRRPGRFDSEISVPVPSAAARLNILKEVLGIGNTAQSVSHRLSERDIEELASKTHGYVGADLQALCKEAALYAIRRFQKRSAKSTSAIPNDQHEKMDVVDSPEISMTRSDFDLALAEVRPSALREIILEIPKVSWNDIGGQEDIKQRLHEAVEWPLKHPEAFVRMGIRPPRGVLLYGPPGCSKTLIAKALASQSGQNFLAVKGPELLSKYVGDSEKAVREIFRKARASAPAILFFDEIDALAVKRGGGGEEGTSATDRVLSQLLTELDGVGTVNAQVLMVAATNRPDILDKALLRPGRIDRILYVAPPDFSARLSIFGIHLRKTPHDLTQEQMDELAKETEGFSGAEVASVCREAGMAAMREDRNATKVVMKHFAEALSGIQPRITAEMLQFYADFREQNTLQSI